MDLDMAVHKNPINILVNYILLYIICIINLINSFFQDNLDGFLVWEPIDAMEKHTAFINGDTIYTLVLLASLGK